jgi:lambda family phage portal protein
MDHISEEEHRQIDALIGTSKTMALGGAYDGAARFDKQIAGWYPPLQSADADMLPDKDILDARSRDIGRNDAYVQGGATLHKDGIVGAFYMLNAKPKWEVLGKTEDWAETFQREVESLFTLWAESPMKWVDASRQNDLTGLVRLAVGVYTFTGETLATVEYVKQKGREFRTAIQMVDTDRLSTPETMRYDPTIRGGLKLDNYGAPQSAFIRVRHPHDIYTAVPEYWWKEVKFQKPWGRQQVIYIREQQRVDQTRAIADIVAGLKEIAITKKFRDVTLQKAVLAATYAATIESELPPQAVYEQIGMTGGAAQATTDYATQFLTALATYTGSSKNMLIDGVKIPHLYPGTKLNFQHAADPAGVGQDFEQSLLRYIAAALNVSYEELARDYSKTNYSSARAAMATTYRFMQSRKRIVADAFASQLRKPGCSTPTSS